MEILQTIGNWAMYNINAGFEALYYNYLSVSQWLGMVILDAVIFIILIWMALKKASYSERRKNFYMFLAVTAANFSTVLLASAYQASCKNFDAFVGFHLVRHGLFAFVLICMAWMCFYFRREFLPRWKGDLILRFAQPLLTCRLVLD